MEFTYFFPSQILRPYVRHYYLFESDSDIEFEDTVFPSGDMEVIFNLGEGVWETQVSDIFSKTAQVELWGQVTKPLVIRSKGRHVMLGVRFFTHSASYFLSDEIGIFNDQVSDLQDIVGSPVKTLHSKLLEAKDIDCRIEMVENFLLKTLRKKEGKKPKIEKLASILSCLGTDQTEKKIESVASVHGISSRYLRKLFYQQTGLSPTSFQKISRFQSSLKLISRNELPLTSIAYDCGYFDQSHFIRDFKSFTGITPSAYLQKKFPVNALIMP